MHPVVNHLVELLTHAGWSVIKREEPDAWWADETWYLESSDGNVVLTFLVDPMADTHRRKKGEEVWAVMASAMPPTQWQRREGDDVLSLGKNWHERAFAFVRNLGHRTKTPNQSTEPMPLKRHGSS
jgi:hypothetical protein